jgi:tyrosyl-tRNA synthetase
MRYYHWFLSPIVLFNTLLADELNSKKLKDLGAISIEISSSKDRGNDLLKDTTVPVIWGIAATSPSLHLGHLASLNIAKSISKDGHELIVIIDNKFAGLDPGNKTQVIPVDKNKSLQWAKSLANQIKQVVGNNVKIYFANDIHLDITIDNLFEDVNLSIYEDRLKALSNLSNPTVRDFIFPIYYALYLENLSDLLKTKKMLIVVGEDQKSNAIFVEKILNNEGIEVEILVHQLVNDPSTNKKFSKSSLNQVSIDDKENVFKFIDELPPQDILKIWYLFSLYPIPLDPIEAKSEMKKIISDSLDNKNGS